MSKIFFDSIPDAMKQLPQWVLHQNKHPKQPSGLDAKSNDSSTWNTFQAVKEGFAKSGFDGIGFVFAKDDPFVGIDLDGCRNPQTGEVADWAMKIVNLMQSYTEISPSGSGLHIVIRAKPDTESGKTKKISGVKKITDKSPGIEVYSQLRYFCITGEVFSVS